MRKAILLITSLSVLPLFFGACKSTTELVQRCVSNEQCVEDMGMPDWVCDTNRGCVCNSDAACPEREHCERVPNGDGRCHPDHACDWNADCPEGQFCDTRSRICRQSGCEVDSQCQLGYVCDKLSSSCVKGCRSHGDCAYMDSCLCPTGDGEEEEVCGCEGLDEAERMECQIGVCDSHRCGDTTFCAPGELCNISANGVQRQCEDDFRGRYCETCDLSPGGSLCGAGANFCITDPDAVGGIFCGVDCSRGPEGGQECPSGFRCAEILQPPPGGRDCRSDADCPTPEDAPLCEEDEDCDPGNWCKAGKCTGKCFKGEGAVAGSYCGCVTDTQCSNQGCGNDGRCEITGTMCMKDEDCGGKIACINDGTKGFCKVGENCAPDDGLSCAEFREIRRSK